ncbi:hypothetical protein Vafri_6022 [Volvox africanus]|uniref:DUF6816 domain-containing protein n=1 Tax=Volvox africanus TaxID=51714 RepID=A0A8J4AXK6_9CHLO|nr:hypothetical protein Vafri_6022 [Volvox africanus]
MFSCTMHYMLQQKTQSKSRVGSLLGQDFHHIVHSIPDMNSLGACSQATNSPTHKYANHELSIPSSSCSSTNRCRSSNGVGISRGSWRAEVNNNIDSSRCALHRRHLLLAVSQVAAVSSSLLGLPVGTAAAAAGASSPPPPPSIASFLQPLLPPPVPDLLAQLEGRAPIFQPGVAWSLRNRDRQLFYPSWLAGEWEVTARFAAASFPQGRRLLGRTVPGVLKGSMVVALPDVGAAVDAPLHYRMRFMESPQGGGVVADRVFNVRQLMDAFYGFEVCRRVEYEPLENPTRMTVVYATPRQDRSVISEDLRKAELIINNRISEQISPTDFICAELFRQISQASAQGFVGDYEIISRYSLLQPGAIADQDGPAPTAGIITPATAVASPPPPPPPPPTTTTSGMATAAAAGGTPSAASATSSEAEVMAGRGAQVKVLQRVAAFLQPQDAAFFEAGNQAVAAYDYTYDLRRVA